MEKVEKSRKVNELKIDFLKPCPRCHTAFVIPFEGEWVAVCDCNPWSLMKEDAIDLWNRRIESWMETNKSVKAHIEREFKEYHWEG
jgi:hypothetical protein